jgi:phenylacetate-coenzyme A ligase PaaK-like adenylate-forming protein
MLIKYGSTATRIINGINGRVDDMIWFKGMNFSPSVVEITVVVSLNFLMNLR